MKTKNLLLMILILISFGCKDEEPPYSELPEPEEEAWVEKSEIPAGHLTAAADFLVGDKWYVGTGIQDSYTERFFEYTPETDTWKELFWFPSDARKYATSFAIGDYGYVGFGSFMNEHFNDLWRYDPKTDSWTEMASFPDVVVDNTPVFTIGDKAYILGVSSDGGHIWEYSTSSDKWTKKAKWPGDPGSGQVSFEVNGKGYVGMGSGLDGPETRFWEYSPATDTWTKKADFPGKPRILAHSLSYKDKGLVVGGWADASASSLGQGLTDIWEYDPVKNEWSETEHKYPGQGRIEMVSAVIGDKILMGLGASTINHGTTGRVGDLWQFTP